MKKAPWETWLVSITSIAILGSFTILIQHYDTEKVASLPQILGNKPSSAMTNAPDGLLPFLTQYLPAQGLALPLIRRLYRKAPPDHSQENSLQNPYISASWVRGGGADIKKSDIFGRLNAY